jgi:hypothetical protein
LLNDTCHQVPRNSKPTASAFALLIIRLTETNDLVTQFDPSHQFWSFNRKFARTRDQLIARESVQELRIGFTHGSTRSKHNDDIGLTLLGSGLGVECNAPPAAPCRKGASHDRQRLDALKWGRQRPAYTPFRFFSAVPALLRRATVTPR